MEDRVMVERIGAVAHVQLNRPEKHNALDLAMFEAIAAAGESLLTDRSVRAVVLSGRGKSFCSGLDFPAFMADPKRATDALFARTDASPANLAQRVGWIWQEVPAAVIAAIHGAAFGGGLQIALGADIRLLGPESRVSVMETRYGIIPDMGISKTLPPLVRTDVARELTFTGRVVDASEALSLGLATRLCEDPVAEALALAQTIASRNPHAVRAAKTLFRDSQSRDVRDAFRLETELQRTLLGSANQIEAVMATMQKREPVFTDS